MKIRHFFLLMLLAGNAAMAQVIAVNKNDASTGTRIVTTRNHRGAKLEVDDSVAKSGLVFFSAGYQKATVNGKEVETYFIDLDIFHNDNKLGCIQQSAENLTLVLEDGSEIKCYQISDTECAHDAYKAAFALGSRSSTITDMQQNFKKLQSVGIEKIKIKTSESSLEYKMKSKSTDYMEGHFALIEKMLHPAK